MARIGSILQVSDTRRATRVTEPYNPQRGDVSVYSARVVTTRTLRDLPFHEALALVDAGAAFIDLRSVEPYLDVHIPGSLCLLYERGPGMASRARDCLPLELPLILEVSDENGGIDLVHAAASLRGKGFTVVGKTSDPINQWAGIRGVPSSTEIVHSTISGSGIALDVGDPGAEHMEDAIRIPIESLWHRVGDELAGAERVAIVSGYGVRAALAVGILERAGVGEVLFWSERLARS
jgi:rhodanese-related sulfurtransferase